MFLPEQFRYKPTKDAIYFGIDLGTTYTLVATIDSAEVSLENNFNIPVKFINYRQQSPFRLGGEVADEKVASIIAHHDGRLFCGNKLYELKGNEAFTRNRNIFYHWKLDLGIDRHPLYPDAVDHELDTPSKIAGKVLNFCRIGFTKNKEASLHNVVITVPASFQMNQRKDVIEAANYAKVELANQMLIDEPNAAFIGYFNSLPAEAKNDFLKKGKNKKNVLVFDIGGGTCDLSILEVGYDPKKGLLIGNKAISRYNDLGGQDIDTIIAEEILYPIFLKQFSFKDEMPFKDLTEIILPQLSTIAELLKIGICNLIAARYPKLDLSDIDMEGISFKLENRSVTYKDIEHRFPPLSLTAHQLDEILSKLFQVSGYSLKYQDKFIKSVTDTITEILEKSNLNKNNIDVLLPVGGSSGNPLLVSKLYKEFPKSAFWIPSNPDKLVAEGAAIYSFFYHRFGRSLVNPISSDTIGIETKGNQFFPLIEKSTELPVKVTLPIFKMQTAFQKEIVVPICLNNTDNIIQEIRIPLENMYSGGETVTISAEINLNKVMSVDISIEDESILNYTLENPYFFGSLSKEQIKFVQIASRLDKARRSNDNSEQRRLMKDLLHQYYNIKNYHEMARLADEYLDKFDSNDDEVLNFKYIGNSNIGRKEAAKVALEKAIQIDPDDPGLHYNYSILLDDINGKEAALNYLLQHHQRFAQYQTMACRIIILKNALGEIVSAKAQQVAKLYETSPGLFSKYDVDNLLSSIYKIAGMTFLKKDTQEKKDRAGKVLVATSLPKPI